VGFTFEPAAAPPPSAGGAYGKLPQFVGKLIVVIPYDKTLSKFKDDNGRPQEQTRSKVIAIEPGSHTDANTGDETTWKAGDVLDVFVSQKKVQAQTKELGKPVLGRLLKDGKAWVLATPTDADVAKANEVAAKVGEIDIPEPGTSKGSTAADDGDGVPW
jgi:hypothetical protein